MKRFLTKHGIVVLSVATVVAVVLSLLSFFSSNTNVLSNIVQTVSSPFRSAATAVTGWVEGIHSYLTEFDALQEENAALKIQIAEMEEQLRQAERDSEENATLRRLLDLREQRRELNMESARIIQEDTSNWASTLMLNIGDSFGVSVGDCVITETGDLVGVISETGSNWSTCTTIIDTDTSIGAQIFRTGDIAYDLARGLFDDTNLAQVQDEFAEGVPFAVLRDSKFGINLLRQCQALGIDVSVMPIPNEEGTITAKIGSYAMGNRNTKYPEEVADLLLYLVGEECQSAAAYADCDSFPVRKGCMQACFDAQYQFSVRDASREKLTEAEIAERQGRYGAPLDAARIKQFETICDQVTAAHYQTIWYRGVDLGQTETGENVASFLHVQYWNDEITLDELIGILSSKMRLYLDE